MSETTPAPRKKIARRIVIDLAIMTVIGIVLALIGPFGSFELPLAWRLVNWVGFAWLGYAIYSPMGFIVDWGERTLDLPRWGMWVAAVLVATIPMTALVWASGFIGREFIWPNLEQAVTSYLYVLVIGGGISALFFALGLNYGEDDAEVAAEPIANISEQSLAQPPFFARLPDALGSDLIALEMEDHYVRAHTALGSDMVLMRLRDAIAELDGADGLQVHRSWWVARGAVENVRRDGRNVRLVLAGGIEAPVSRANVSVLKEAGWI